MRILDLFAGRLGWSKAFLARGWEVTAVDIERPSEIPKGMEFVQLDILKMHIEWIPLKHFNVIGRGPNPFWQWSSFDFICASPPCEEFSVHGMKCFHPNPKYPEMGIKLFNHTRRMCEESGAPYVIENVRAAQRFVGDAASHCGPFYLWGSGAPALLPQGISKESMIWSPKYRNMKKSQRRREVATIPPELANCVAEYAERLLEVSA